MLVRSLLVLAAGLVTAQLLSALPLDSDSLETDTLLKQESEQLSTSLESSGSAPVVREKRTIGFLRQAFPTVSQIIDRKIQAITRILFRLIGRLVLRGAAGGGGGGGGSDDADERRVQITLPTFPPSEDDEDEEDEDSTGGLDDSTTTTTEPSADENAVAESKVAPVVVRKTRQAPAQAAAEEEEEYEDDDQAVAASNDNEVSQSAEEDVDDSESAETEDQRDKRFSGGTGSAGSGGGSGNFLFDIIRLVAGSGTTQSQDEADNAPLDDNATHAGEDKTGVNDVHDDGYSAGVPGPLTRLFVIANRGIANLIQDLILRLAQTSERIVNFKARLITSII